MLKDSSDGFLKNGRNLNCWRHRGVGSIVFCRIWLELLDGRIQDSGVGDQEAGMKNMRELRGDFWVLR